MEPLPLRFILADGIPQRSCPYAPTSDGLKTLPATFTSAFQMNYAAERGTGVAVRVNRLATFWAFELKQLRMLQGAAHKGTKPHRIRGNLGYPAAAVGHFHVEGNEVETVDILPLFDNSAMNVPSRAFSNVPFVTDSNVPLQMWLL